MSKTSRIGFALLLYALWFLHAFDMDMIGILIVSTVSAIVGLLMIVFESNSSETP